MPSPTPPPTPSPTASSPRGARLGLLVAALLFSTGGAAVKATSLGAWQVASFRSGIAAATLLLLLPASRRLGSGKVWLVGIGYAATMVLYVVGNKLTTAANTIFLQSTAPLYVLLLGPWLLREPVRRKDVALMGLIAVGMACFFVGRPEATAIATDPFTGNLLGAASGATWAGTLMGLRWLQREGTGAGVGAASVVAGNTLACLGCLPLALATPLTEVAPTDWAWVIYLGVVQIGVAYWLLTDAIRHVPALEASLLLLLEPVLNPVFAWLLHGEAPGGWAVAGGVVILVATLLRSIRRRSGTIARSS